MNNGVNNTTNNEVVNNNAVPTTNVPENGVVHEEIKAARSYKLDPENAPKEIPKREVPVWEKPKEEKVEEAPQPIVIEKPVRSKNLIARFLLIVVLLMGAYIGYSKYQTTNIINKLNGLSSPITTLGEERELSLDNPIILDLYSKVKTNIREDIAESTLNDSMKMYLAFRAIPHDKIYETNCDGFDNSVMVPLTCNNADKKTPKTFKKEAILIEYTKLFGEKADFNYTNILIGRNCMGGYQYVESRGEYIQGFCQAQPATLYNATKKLVKATTKESIITLQEEVKYSSNEGQALPETLKSGTYIYTFKLDKNYNYIYVSKALKQEG